jgi:NAD(P)-dependent dehydrogenase (short-subunit alcohol dehydrogenase family)
MKLANRHAAVTGGGGEIGFAIARQLGEEGATVTLLDKVIAPEIGSEAKKLGFRFVATDVTDPASVSKAVGSLAPIDIAVANAGVHRGARALDLSSADWLLMMAVNATGVFLFAQAAARRMVEAKAGGSIVVTGSWVQDVPNVDNTGYCASNAAAAMIARCMALELGEHGIRVNVVAPGIVNAGMAKRQIQVDPAFAKKAAKGIPLGALQTAEQVARAVAFLCSDEAESVTGTTLLVDGGLSLFKYE